jgi:predicted dehydrogenase/MoaA/NifB/PqqE/SkfB family radical SAM enzyme
VVLRTNALAFRAPAEATRLAGLGVGAVLVPFFSQNPAVHDRIAGRPEALVQALVGVRSLSEAGVAVEAEVPLLSGRLQSPEAVVDLVHRAVPALRAVRFFLPLGPLPPALAPPRWDEGAPALAAALRRCRALGVKARLHTQDAIPLCALRDAPDLHDAYAFPPRARVKPPPGAAYPEPCEGCAARRQCSGVVAAYREAHGAGGLAAYGHRPRAMYAQRSPGAPVFTAEHRKAASGAGMVVLRPTVNCNQDCSFCSANETSGNVWTDPAEMLKAISRTARRGVERISFSGGEPTLSRDLPMFLDAARRLGIREIELVTNGVLLDDERRVRRLREAGLTHAFVSLHAHDEHLSRVMTQKVGDHARTVRALHLLLDAGVETLINHVITARNFPYLRAFVEFVHREFSGKIRISFAFVTPQYKAIDNFSLVPKLSDVLPDLRRAMYRALELGQPFHVGSRQGIPPCFLREFAAWSDVLGLSSEAASEDAPQKQRAETCNACRYSRPCTGLWQRYVAAYGLGELKALPGGVISDEELREYRSGRGELYREAIHSFEDVPERLRDRAAEREGLAWFRSDTAAPASPARALPVLPAERSRPVRVALVGSGLQARRLARAARSVPGISIDAVASPHAPEADLLEFGGCPAFRSLEEVLDEVRPEGIVIAAATHAHHDLARLALARGVPALVEKPFTRTEAEAEALVLAASERPGTPLIPAHNMVFSAGVEALYGADHLPEISFTRRCPPGSPDAVRSWGRLPLAEVLYHALSLVGHAAGGGVPRIEDASFQGASAPERIRLRLAYERARGEVVFDFTGTEEDVSLTRRALPGAPVASAWRRSGPKTSLRVDGRDAPLPGGGSDAARMLAHFRDVVLGKARPLLGPRDGLDVLRATRAAVAALDEAGAPFERSSAPRHVASAELDLFPRPRHAP